MGIMETIFINHFERSSVPTRSQQSYLKCRESGLESTVRDFGRESAMILTCHNYKSRGKD